MALQDHGGVLGWLAPLCFEACVYVLTPLSSSASDPRLSHVYHICNCVYVFFVIKISKNYMGGTPIDSAVNSNFNWLAFTKDILLVSIKLSLIP